MRYGSDHRNAQDRESWMNTVRGGRARQGAWQDRGDFDPYSRRDFLTNQGDFSDPRAGGGRYDARGRHGRDRERELGGHGEAGYAGGRRRGGGDFQYRQQRPGASGGYGSDRGISSGYGGRSGSRYASEMGGGYGAQRGQPGMMRSRAFGEERASRWFGQRGMGGQWESDPYDIAYRDFRDR